MRLKPWEDDDKLYAYQECPVCGQHESDLQKVLCVPCEALGFDEKLVLVDPMEIAGEPEEASDR